MMRAGKAFSFKASMGHFLHTLLVVKLATLRDSAAFCLLVCFFAEEAFVFSYTKKHKLHADLHPDIMHSQQLPIIYYEEAVNKLQKHSKHIHVTSDISQSFGSKSVRRRNVFNFIKLPVTKMQ